MPATHRPAPRHLPGRLALAAGASTTRPGGARRPVHRPVGPGAPRQSPVPLPATPARPTRPGRRLCRRTRGGRRRPLHPAPHAGLVGATGPRPSAHLSRFPARRAGVVPRPLRLPPLRRLSPPPHPASDRQGHRPQRPAGSRPCPLRRPGRELPGPPAHADRRRCPVELWLSAQPGRAPRRRDLGRAPARPASPRLPSPDRQRRGRPGLRAGVALALPEVPCHADVFHPFRDPGQLVRFLEDRAYTATSTCDKLQRRLQQPRRRGLVAEARCRPARARPRRALGGRRGPASPFGCSAMCWR